MGKMMLFIFPLFLATNGSPHWVQLQLQAKPLSTLLMKANFPFLVA